MPKKDNGYSRAVDSGDILLVCTCEACTCNPRVPSQNGRLIAKTDCNGQYVCTCAALDVASLKPPPPMSKQSSYY